MTNRLKLPLASRELKNPVPWSSVDKELIFFEGSTYYKSDLVDKEGRMIVYKALRFVQPGKYDADRFLQVRNFSTPC